MKIVVVKLDNVAMCWELYLQNEHGERTHLMTSNNKEFIKSHIKAINFDDIEVIYENL